MHYIPKVLVWSITAFCHLGLKLTKDDHKQPNNHVLALANIHYHFSNTKLLQDKSQQNRIMTEINLLKVLLDSLHSFKFGLFSHCTFKIYIVLSSLS